MAFSLEIICFTDFPLRYQIVVLPCLLFRFDICDLYLLVQETHDKLM